MPARKKKAETAAAGPARPFLQLDYLYTPSADVAEDMRFFSEVLGGRVAFAIDSMGTRMAKIELTSGAPHVLLTDHLEGERSIFVYRVDDLDAAVAELSRRGWRKGAASRSPWARVARSQDREGTASRSTS